ncbi:MAG: thioredoxin domain-containing protein [Firmicutes bacterium]|nr:thioredoxin domain-containing protein [Bacillota bacterium]
MTNKNAVPNRLIREKSPYLLQHAYNPVHWYPWGKEAFDKAQALDRPIFLSIGYSSCHWCHVMARESFEDEEVAAILNKHFISIKVDREERPDIDHIYMEVCQAMTGRGGWPLTIIMDAHKKPFFAGTYFPKKSKMGLPGLIEILKQTLSWWQSRRDDLLESGNRIIEALRRSSPRESGKDAPPAKETLPYAARQLEEVYDSAHGGLGKRPKFPTATAFLYLLRWHHYSGEESALEMVAQTLHSMRRGGIYDQLGFGFHRYAVDRRWLVPHFEKMLYDQALLCRLYAESFQLTGEPLWQQTVEEIITYVLRDLSSPEGVFYAAENAESEGVEGKFYIWHQEEIESVLPAEQAKLFQEYYGVTAKGNFEDNTSILHLPHELSDFAGEKKLAPAKLLGMLEDCRQKLLAVRQQRVRPSRDEKILTSWNGLMISALVKAYQALKNSSYKERAIRAADFFLKASAGNKGSLFHSYIDGSATSPGFLDDYAFFTAALLDLYEATFQARFLQKALELAHKTKELFWDEANSGFYYSPRGAEPLPLNPKEALDASLPSGTAVATLNMLRLGQMLRQENLRESAGKIFKLYGSSMRNNAVYAGSLLSAFLFYSAPVEEFIIVGKAQSTVTKKFLKIIKSKFLPHKTVLFIPCGEEHDRQILQSIAPWINRYPPLKEEAAVYLCRNYTCLEPIADPEQLEEILAPATAP